MKTTTLSSIRTPVFTRTLFQTVPFVLATWFTLSAAAQESPNRPRREPPTLTVSGRGEAFAAPDSATIRLGAVAEHKEAAKAQAEVNETVQRALKALMDLKIPENKIKTAGLSLTPVYERQERAPGSTQPRLTGYHARNTLQVEIEDLQQIGQLVDVAVAAGANQIESLSFQLKDDRQTRQRALRLASDDARGKAEALSAALGLQLGGVREVTEGGVHVVQPRMELAQARFGFGQDQSTPVQPGEVQVEASVTIRFDLAGSPGGGR